MNVLKLKETMEQIHMKEEMCMEIIRNVENMEKNRKRRADRWKKTGMAAAVFALILGAAVPIQAGIRFLAQDRMEQLPQKELEDARQVLQKQKDVEADGFSREYTKEERERLEQLEADYTNGTFPEQKIIQAESMEQIPEDVVGYAVDTGTFYLPDRALTDEELLQIIDFQNVQDYAATKGTAAQQAVQARRQEEDSMKKAVKEKGGITEKQAKKAADRYLKKEFGLSAKNTESEIMLDRRPDGDIVYHVSYRVQDDAYYYSYGIDVNSKDGSLKETSSASLPKDRGLWKNRK